MQGSDLSFDDNPSANYRDAARRLGVCLLVGFCTFLWISSLTFDSQDWPSPKILNHPTPSNNACGWAGALVSFALFYYLGIGALPLLVGLTLAAALWILQRRVIDFWLRCTGLLLLVAVICCLAAMAGVAPNALPRGGGGILGVAIHYYLGQNFRTTGSVIVLTSAVAVGALLVADDLLIRIPQGFRWLTNLRENTPAGSASTAIIAAPIASGIGEISPTNSANDLASIASANEIGQGVDFGSNSNDSVDDQDDSWDSESTIEPGSFESNGSSSAYPDFEEDESIQADPVDVLDLEDSQVEQAADEELEPQDAFEEVELDDDDLQSGDRLPIVPSSQPVAAANDPTAITDDDDIGHYDLPCEGMLLDGSDGISNAGEFGPERAAHVLVETLQTFNIEAKIASIEAGPVITMYELELGTGVKISRVVALTHDIARAMKASTVRVVPTLPGKDTIAIEAPNASRQNVPLADVMTEAGRRDPGSDEMALPLYLGKTARGQVLVSDLSKMPHLLVAGATGSGKSVCLNSVILSLLMKKHPADARLVLIDPKVVELKQFEGAPHLLCPIVTELNKAAGVIEWAVNKMEERYAQLAEAGVQNIRAYNRLGREELIDRLQPSCEEEELKIPFHLPHIVIVVDELADLMMSHGKTIEHNLVRLAQKSRAVGIHLILATQRPQATVVTGLIKSNLPARIAFRVASKLDSRIVLDQNGAETLLGEGDMLFLPPGQHRLIRSQGTFVSDAEIKKVLSYLREAAAPKYASELVQMSSESGSGVDHLDELFDLAGDIVVQSGRGSVSLLQRRLSIGYGRAARLIDQMAGLGVVGDYNGSQARQVLISDDQWTQMREEICGQETEMAR
jgi:S-DNA-T family DNA segregation ATPase FtsK/SpoIIIE